MSEVTDFLWTFPCFFLAKNCTVNSDTHEVMIDENIRFVAPEDASGEKKVAIFTDQHLADEFREVVFPKDELRRLTIPGPKALRRLLLTCGHYRYVAVDLNPTTRIGRVMEIQDLIAGLDTVLKQIEGQSGE